MKAAPCILNKQLRLLFPISLLTGGWLVAGLLLAWVAGDFQGLAALPSFLAVLAVGGGLLALGWWLLRRESPPPWLLWTALLAFLLRLGAGVIWFQLLPAFGHGTPAEKAGYIMADASERDQAAWKLAQSGKSLSVAFMNNRMSDQYGGLLFLSALTYRYLGGSTHQPLLIVILTAAFSSLAVFFVWAFARRAWRAQVGTLAAWLLVFYPEAVLIGSSQMREAFVITFVMAAFYGLARYRQDHSRQALAWMFGALLLCLPFSPPLTAMLFGLLVFAAMVTLGRFSLNQLHHKRFWLAAGVLTALILIGLWLTLQRFTPEDVTNPLSMLSWWFRKSADLQAYLSRHASGWLQKVFRSSPEWLHLPLLVGYGVVQPFLPAALVVGSRAQLWPWIALARSAGWTLILGLLLYAPFAARLQRRPSQNGINQAPVLPATQEMSAAAFCIIVWLTILVASFRGGGDMWDNPRYRAAFAGLQVALAAWAWLEQRRAADPWFRRAVVGLVAILFWFVPWYLRRYTAFDWPVVDLFKTLGLGVATAGLFAIWDWSRATEPSEARSPAPTIEELQSKMDER